ncbi:hypothetical protein [Kribbella sp. DT2]|uniref:ApeA N-terminal domain 1-containing protein n=1 Tax=Kribbella sp. DT2 TaxID=3393427 RepID=UPI003CF54801
MTVKSALMDKFRDGCIGTFVPIGDASGVAGDWENGHIQLRADGNVHVVTLDENSPRMGPDLRSDESGIAGFTEHGGILLPNVSARGSTSNFGGTKVSVLRYQGPSMVAGIDPEDLRSNRFTSAEAHFFGLDRWTGVSGITSNVARKVSDGTAESVTLELKSAPEQRANLGSRVLYMSTHWEVGGSKDRPIVHAPLVVGVSVKRRRELHELTGPLVRIQQLISLAYGGFVTAAMGRVMPNLGSEQKMVPLWDKHLMWKADSMREPKSMTEVPLFSLATLGGLQTLSRWVRLGEAYGRAAGPVVAPFWSGTAAVESRLLEACVGIEYWIAINKVKKAGWAKHKDATKCRPLTLAKRVSSRFDEWVGDSEKWGVAVWEAYNLVKHDPTKQLDQMRGHVLAESARYLLFAALLDRVAGSKSGSWQIFDSHRLYNLGRAVRRELGT